MEIRINDQILIPESELRWSFSKSSAPGGQGVNTTDSRARLSWNLVRTTVLPDELKQRALINLEGKIESDGDVSVVVESERSQLQNRLIALDRMRDLIREAIAPPPAPRVATRPSRASREERLGEKRHQSDIKKNRRTPRDED